MKRPGPTSSDHPTADWSHYWDDIAAAASRGHRPEVTWDCGVAYVVTGEDLTGTHLTFWPCQPRWVATSTLIDNDAQCEPADADPRLLPLADGPDLDADSTDVGAWMATVITAIAGHRPDGPSYRDVPADGYTQSPGQ